MKTLNNIGTFIDLPTMKKLVYILLFRHSLKSTTLYENILSTDVGLLRVVNYIYKKQEEKTTAGDQDIQRIYIKSLLALKLIPTIYNITGEELRLIKTKNNNRNLTDTEKIAINDKYPIRKWFDFGGWLLLFKLLLDVYADYGIYKEVGKQD